ncbi:hypothetical protein QQP08_015662 [Theobroma cacao]|nr:hypothetical protein QQP08_015662 [Theobroma cacao]
MDDVKRGWAAIHLDPSGKQLVQWPVEEIETLRGKRVQIRNTQFKPGEHMEIKGISGSQPLDPSWKDPQDLCYNKKSKVGVVIGPFGLLALASEKLEEFTLVFFRIFKAQNKHVVLISALTKRVYKPTFDGFVDVDLSNKKFSLRNLMITLWERALQLEGNMHLIKCMSNTSRLMCLHSTMELKLSLYKMSMPGA